MGTCSLILCGTHCERPAKVGETIGFYASPIAFAANRVCFDATVRWQLKYNGEFILNQGEFSAGDRSAGVVFTAERPGWYMAIFEVFRNGELDATGKIGALVEPELLEAALPVPEDFDEFWKKQLDSLHRIPAEMRLTPLNSSDLISTFALQANGGDDGVPLRGVLARPAKTVRGGHPAILLPHGAGVRSSDYGRIAVWAAKGFLALDVNAHGLENGHEPSWYEEKDKEYMGYPIWGFESGDPEKPYMRNVFLRLVRALECLSDMPEWDGRNLWVFGGSQAAWQGLAGAALMPKVSGAALWIPAGCDIYAGGWPFAHLIGQERPEGLRRTLPYYDAGSFATRIKDIPVMVSMGLVDEVCKADGVSAVYNRLATPLKRRELHERMQHETGSSVILELTRFIMGNLK